ncbi:MAG: hypothetical protein HOF84_07010 [Rhodospirillales bacterium]|nr:hypothetical protein [Rhodospirillales bacterium]
MGGLATIFEEEGLATTQISLIRLHTEKTNPPRALWVPFELGRPLGVPNDAAFQTRVLTAAFELLDADSGPLLTDYLEEAPEGDPETDEEAMTGMVCPISLPKVEGAGALMNELSQSLTREINSLAPWYDLAVRKRGRTTIGPSGLEIEDAAKFFAAFIENQQAPAPRDDLAKGRVLKLAYEDLKAYYTEAITAQPGYGASLRVENWLFNETVFRQALWKLREICRASDDEYYIYLGRNSIIPDRQINAPEDSTERAG